MFHRIKVLDIELSHPPVDIEGLEGYATLKGLVRLHDIPLGYVQLPITNGRCSAALLRKTILEQHHWAILTHLLQNLLATTPKLDGWNLSDLFNNTCRTEGNAWPLVSVAVCTRDRPAELILCLEALNKVDYPHLEILVIDNAPTSDATERLIASSQPNVRYIYEPRPGLDWARNRAIVEARGEIIAYTDDDVIVDSGWVKALARVFVENPEVMAVTGLVTPYELETEAQFLFERYGGFGRGFERKWYRLNRASSKKEQYHLGTGAFGTGANMAYRRSLFEQIGCFDPALDVGTVTNGGGDLEMFFRVLKEGHTLVYEPAAIVYHRHRRDYQQLKTQLTNNGIGFYSYLVRSALAYPDERANIIRLGVWWLRWWNLRRLLISFVHPAFFPRDLILAELKGSFTGLKRYRQAQQNAAQIATSYDAQAWGEKARNGTLRTNLPRLAELTTTREKADNGFGNPSLSAAKLDPAKFRPSTAVRTVELTRPIAAITDITSYAQVRLFVTWYNYPVGSVDIPNHHAPISAIRLCQLLAHHFGLKLLKLGRDISMDSFWAEAISTLYKHYYPVTDHKPKAKATTNLPVNVSVSVVLATHDRPDDLRKCLNCLVHQNSPRRVEIVVVDNNPASGVTPSVVAEYPGVKLISEARKGLSYARNAGIVASVGDIIIATDDDVTMPPDWLERLVTPFARSDVMIVTGNVLPAELETQAQHLFEKYGGLGRGFDSFEVNKGWFESFRREAVPTWRLGATANAAFRAEIFSHPEIGLMDEALGVGTPTGCSEDTYLFYQVLRAGYTLVYEPGAYVWHNHRRTIEALRKQIYGYSKGHVAYHLTTILRYGDLRGLKHITLNLPGWHLKQIFRYCKRRLRGKPLDYPLSLILLEIKGHLAGPWALWRSRLRVKREGHSQPYIPVSQRLPVKTELPLTSTAQLNNEMGRGLATNIS
jgi:GT2 family glycosyltransferase